MLRPPSPRLWLGGLAAAAAAIALAPQAPAAIPAPSPESVLGFVPGEEVDKIVALIAATAPDIADRYVKAFGPAK